MDKANKSDPAYWEPRVYTPGTKNFYVRIQMHGQRHPLPLKATDRKQAAKEASLKWMDIRLNGWPEDPRPTAQNGELSVGEYLQKAKKAYQGRAASFRSYEKALLRILRASESAPRAIPISSITPAHYFAWRDSKPNLAPQSVKSELRAAKNAFGDEIRAAIKQRHHHEIEDPFSDVAIPKVTTARYRSKISPEHLFSTLQADLTKEEKKAFILALFAGMRRVEIDNAKCQDLDLDSGGIHVSPNQETGSGLKTIASEGFVPVDRPALELLMELMGTCGGTNYILCPDKLPSPSQIRDSNNYRCNPVYKGLLLTLRQYQAENGEHPLDVKRPLHELRKEFGSVVATKFGIYYAQRLLRHSSPVITESVYADLKDLRSAGILDSASR